MSFVYFYDTTNVKSVTLTLEGGAEPRAGAVYPLLVEAKGPNPVEFENGYVAYEDLPDDKRKMPSDLGDDDDADSDEDGNDGLDEPEEEVYDEDEDQDF